MDIDPKILVELTKMISEQNENPVRILKNLTQNDSAEIKAKSYMVQLGDSTLILSKTKNPQCSETKHQKFLDQLDQIERQKKLYYQICQPEEPLVVPKYGILEETIHRIRGGTNLTEAAWLLITIWMLQQQSEGFQPINPAPMPPHIESARSLLFGKPKSDSFSSRQDQSRFQTQLDMGRSRRSRSVRQINMNEEYQKFLLIKHPETDCSQERFQSLCTDPQRKIIDESSIKEAIIILEAEGRGIVQGAERPDLDNGEPNLDFKVNGPGKYRYVDVKEPRNYGRGNQVLGSAASNMGHKINKQKDQSKFSISRKEILHIVNFELLDPAERTEYQTNIFSPHGSEDITIIDIRKRN